MTTRFRFALDAAVALGLLLAIGLVYGLDRWPSGRTTDNPSAGPTLIVVAQPEPPPDQKLVEPKDPGPRPSLAPSAAGHHEMTFLGSRGRGQRFCIVADKSGSMSGQKLADLKSELIKTLNGLDQKAQFYIIFFSSGAMPMPYPTWLNGGPADVGKVRPWVDGIRAGGSTQPTPAMRLAFQLEPRPDVIFFMTDGLIPSQVPDEIELMNDRVPKVTVNSILFGRGGTPRKSKGQADNYLRKIAEQSGGTFTRYGG